MSKMAEVMETVLRKMQFEQRILGYERIICQSFDAVLVQYELSQLVKSLQSVHVPDFITWETKAGLRQQQKG